MLSHVADAGGLMSSIVGMHNQHSNAGFPNCPCRLLLVDDAGALGISDDTDQETLGAARGVMTSFAP